MVNSIGAEPPDPGSGHKVSGHPRIHVVGDAYQALLYLPPGKLHHYGDDNRVARVNAIPVGVEYIYRAIRATCAPQRLAFPDQAAWIDRLLTRVASKLGEDPGLALYEVTCEGDIDSYDSLAKDWHESPTKKLPLLRLAGGETRKLALGGFAQERRELCGASEDVEQADILVEWFGELAVRDEQQSTCGCDIHLQVGLNADLNGDSVIPSMVKGSPRKARIVVANIGEFGTGHRIRKSLSYEAIAVDMLHLLRGNRARAKPGPMLVKLFGEEQGRAPLCVLATRLNNSAVFVYACGCVDPSKAGEDGDFKEHAATIVCLDSECAPLSRPALGKMLGYTGFISAQIATALALHWEDSGGGGGPDSDKVLSAVLEGVRRGLLWQWSVEARGYCHLLFDRSGKAPRDNWFPTSWDVDSNEMGYERQFKDVARSLGVVECGAQIRENTLEESRECIECLDKRLGEKVHSIAVDVSQAVAHRTQWFMARSVAAARLVAASPGNAIERSATEISEKELEKQFLNIALDWLCEPGGVPRVKSARWPSIPVVKIGIAELTDRREVEDYLAIHQALNVYAKSSEPRPLNIAVFGAPGAGKSFAVNQLISFIGAKEKGVFKEKSLSFNLSQFNCVDDLASALNKVRNECLTPGLPIVFFDEFDSSFNGQPFGWIKYFLAPMQDASFYHDGQDLKLGRAVFVFAGGVNRNFEELNGRLRNPGFCEAKGPDFISRLKAHLNVQGINRPEDEEDQMRYILRRGVLLRGMVRRKLSLKGAMSDHELMHRSVAEALLRVDGFRHGVRSLESIISMCATRPGHRIGPSDLPSMDQLDMHVDAAKLLGLVERIVKGM